MNIEKFEKCGIALRVMPQRAEKGGDCLKKLPMIVSRKKERLERWRLWEMS